MSTEKYSSASLYAVTPQQSAYNINYLDFWDPPAVTGSTSDTLISLDSRYDKRPDLLSFDLYQTVEYWWVFMVRNPDVISDPIWDFKTGIQIFVPSKDMLPRSSI